MSRSGMPKACPERPREFFDIIPGMSPSVCRLIDKTSQSGAKVRISTPNQCLKRYLFPESTGRDEVKKEAARLCQARRL